MHWWCVQFPWFLSYLLVLRDHRDCSVLVLHYRGDCCDWCYRGYCHVLMLQDHSSHLDSACYCESRPMSLGVMLTKCFTAGPRAPAGKRQPLRVKLDCSQESCDHEINQPFPTLVFQCVLFSVKNEESSLCCLVLIIQIFKKKRKKKRGIGGEKVQNFLVNGMGEKIVIIKNKFFLVLIFWENAYDPHSLFTYDAEYFLPWWHWHISTCVCE